MNLAPSASLGELKQECARVKAAAQADDTERHRRIHRSRRFRHWTDSDGAFAFAGRTTADQGARLLAAMKPYHDRIFNDARKQERRESQDAYAIDALISLAEASRTPTSAIDRKRERSTRDDTHNSAHMPTSAQPTAKEGPRPRRTCSCGIATPPGGPRALVHVRVDHSALVRGRAERGETCEIAGVGPVPVATAKKMMNDAFLAAIVTHGVDVRTVSHMGRTIPAHIRTALMERDPQCVVPGCTATEHLEIDHVIPFADGGPTRLDNLVRLCAFHHDQKTYSGFQLAGTAEHPTWTKVGPSRENPYRRSRDTDRSPP